MFIIYLREYKDLNLFYIQDNHRLKIQVGYQEFQTLTRVIMPPITSIVVEEFKILIRKIINKKPVHREVIQFPHQNFTKIYQICLFNSLCPIQKPINILLYFFNQLIQLASDKYPTKIFKQFILSQLDIYQKSQINQHHQKYKIGLTLKNYKNERVKKHNSSQNESLELKDLKREESLKRLKELEIQLISNKNEQFGIQSQLSKNNSYLQLKNLSSNIQLSAQKNNSANKDNSANKGFNQNLYLNDQSNSNKFSKIDKIQEVQSFVFNPNQDLVQKKVIVQPQSEKNNQNKLMLNNSKENINLNSKIQQSQNSQMRFQNNTNNQAPVKQKSYSLYQANNQETLGFNSFSSNNNKQSKNKLNNANNESPQKNKYINQELIVQKQLLQPTKQYNNQQSSRQKTEQNDDVKKQTVNKQIQILKTQEDFDSNSQKKSNIILQQNSKSSDNSNREKNQLDKNASIFSKENNSQYPSSIQNIPPVFMGANVNKSIKSQNQQSGSKQLNSATIQNSGNKNYYYNEKYMSDSQRKKESILNDKSPSMISNSGGVIAPNNNGVGYSQITSKSVTPEPIQKSKLKLDSNRNSMHMIRNVDNPVISKQESIFRINNTKTNNNSSYNSNSNILPTNITNEYNSNNKSSERLLYHPSQSTNAQKADLSKRNSNSFLRKSANNGLPLVSQDQLSSRLNSKSLHIAKQKQDRQQSIEISQAIDNHIQIQQNSEQNEDNQLQINEQIKLENGNGAQQLQKNQSSLSELRLRRIRQVNASNSKLNIKLPNMSMQQNSHNQSIQNTEPSENGRQIKSIKRVAKPNLSLNRIIDDKSGQIKEETKKRIQQIIEKQFKNKKMFGAAQQADNLSTGQNNLQQSKGEMVTDELKDTEEQQLYGVNYDQEKEIKGYIKGLMDVLKNISSAKKVQNLPSLKNSPIRKIKMKKRDSISILSSLNQSLFNSANSSLERKKQGIEPISNKKLQNKLSASKQVDQFQDQKLNNQNEAFDSLVKGKKTERKKTPSSVQKQLDYSIPSQYVSQQKYGNNQSPEGRKIKNENGLCEQEKEVDYQHIIQNSVSKREYNPQNYNYPEPINQEIKEMSIKKMQQSSITHFQNSYKKEKQFYYEDQSPIKTISNPNGSQKLSLNDLKEDQQNNTENKVQELANKPLIAQPYSVENSSNYYYFVESVPQSLNQINVQSLNNDDKQQMKLLQKSSDAIINREKRSASTHRILGREKPVGELRSLRLNTSQKERSATIHHGGEEIPNENNNDNEEGEQLGVFCTDSKKEMLLKVRRGRSVIKTINPYKSAEKISSNLRKSHEKYSNQKLGLSQNRCTSEPRGINHDRLPSASLVSGINQDDAQASLNDNQKQFYQISKQQRTISVPNYKFLQPNYGNPNNLTEQDQEESKNEANSQIQNANSFQQNQPIALKKSSAMSFGIQEKQENDEVLSRVNSQKRSNYQKMWIDQISSNLTEQISTNIQIGKQEYQSIQEKHQQGQNIQNLKPSNNNNNNNNKIYINEMQHKKIVGSQNQSGCESPFVSYQSVIAGVVPEQQKKESDLTELVELLEDEQLDHQTWKKKSGKKGNVAAIHFTPSKRVITNQSHKTAHCSFIDGNETVRTEVIGPIIQSQLFFQDENENEVSQITPQQMNQFKSRNSFLSFDLMQELNLRRSNQNLLGHSKNQNNLNPSSMINQNYAIQQYMLANHYQPSPLKNQKSQQQQQTQVQQLFENIQIKQNQGIQSSSRNSMSSKERIPISVAMNYQQDQNQQEANYQGYDYNPDYELQQNQYDQNFGNQISYRSRGYFRKPPTHRSYKSKISSEDNSNVQNSHKNTSINSYQDNKNQGNNIKIQQYEKPPTQQNKLLSQQIEQQQQQYQNVLSRKQTLSDNLGLENKLQRQSSYDNQKRNKIDQQILPNQFQQYQQKLNDNPITQGNQRQQQYNPEEYKVNKQNESENEERILDLLLLDTHELKDKLREQPTRNRLKNDINSNNYNDIVKSLPIPPELPPNKNIFQEYNQKIFQYDHNLQ
ncbi:hypothetical protein TTHERM_00715680 (macronuclear) [Tetrahymena thermophila SB210]|uniref:Uncharacterized protein n=1 Tax=Tetrahymena thermophila (strain SB210) TaxID=312017 RepID=I7MCL8_TETTS|nr:hypothetical protein TTHERM_00715680 [Tetrahymena thermophila SB210]EAR84264.2 hypothetical protein TTHERM_00715680 [Tetrahymena thermophila SB210]|eukprot:XP_001031927.2 hypothetical protein TTHERM_00715680 [Tetrahymena thermophila SB210]